MPDNTVDKWLLSLADSDKSRHTLRSYAGDLRLFAHWYEETTGETFGASEVTPSDIREYRSWLLAHSARPATINRRLSALREFFRWARDTRLVTDDPTERIRNVESQRLAPRWLDKRDLYRLIRTVERSGSKRDLAIVLMLRYTGLRASEVAGLQLADVTIGDRSGEVVVRGKGSKIRDVPLNVDVRRALNDYLAERGKDPGPLWLSGRSDHLGADAIHHLVTKYARLAGVRATPHTLRHTFAKTTLSAGNDLVTVSTLLGHARIDTTAIYTQPSMRDLQRAVDTIAEG